MNSIEAEEIIHQYGAAIENCSGAVVRRSALLPCSKARIRQAYFIYLEEGIKNGLLEKNNIDLLISTYSYLHSFIEDFVADELVETVKLMKEKKIDMENANERDRADRFMSYARRFVQDPNDFEEISDFVGECQKIN